ncbi:MAG: sigma-70 family RNA polymerase sigma factor [Candidatus Omnitrophota bacterium]|nr:sigma-70 family RNA polymerase sigma factor [Candidatus Omnitrophota bacterium]
MTKEACFQGLIGKFSPKIKRIAYKLNGRYRSFDHDDLYQEAVFHLWNSFCSGRLENKTDSYILQGCYFHLKNCIRKINEKPNVISLESLSDPQDGARAAEALLSSHAIEDGTRERVDVKMVAASILNNGFSPKEKNILLFLSEGLTTREIGSKTGVSHVSVVKAVKKIRQKSYRHIDKF